VNPVNTPSTVESTLAALLLCGILGLVGQGIRAIVGLKNANALASTTPSQQSVFSESYLLFSLMIGFIVGVIAGITLNLQNISTVDPSNWKLLLGIIGSGYVGADFIENTMSLFIPGPGVTAPGGVVTAPVVTPGGTAVVAPPAPPPPPLPDTGITTLTSALSIVSPKVNTAVWAPALVTAFSKFDLNTNRRQAAAIGQFLAEAGPAFNELVENLNYSAEQAARVFHGIFATPDDARPFIGDHQRFGNHVYANRNGNGNEASGDGFRFRGRGLIQLTGRTEYTDFGKFINKSPEDAAQFCETAEGAAFSGCWYLSTRGCLPFADTFDIDAITRRVNGSAMEAAEQRRQFSNSMLKHLGG
jgi:predicted chitinase